MKRMAMEDRRRRERAVKLAPRALWRAPGGVHNMELKTTVAFEDLFVLNAGVDSHSKLTPSPKFRLKFAIVTKVCFWSTSVVFSAFLAVGRERQGKMATIGCLQGMIERS